MGENIKEAKGNECSQYKSTAAIFSSSLPIFPVYFHLVRPRHVLNPCYARYERTRGIKGYITYYLALCEVTSAKHAVLFEVKSAKHVWVSLEKIWMGQMGRLEEIIPAALLYWLHSFPLACVIFSGNGHVNHWLCSFLHCIYRPRDVSPCRNEGLKRYGRHGSHYHFQYCMYRPCGARPCRKQGLKSCGRRGNHWLFSFVYCSYRPCDLQPCRKQASCNPTIW